MRADTQMVVVAPYGDLVHELIADVLGVPREKVFPDAALTHDLGAESIDFLDLVFRIEDVIGRRIPIGRWERFIDERLPDGDHRHTITAEIVREFAEREACR